MLALALVTAFALFGLRTRLLYGLLRLGQPVNRFDDLPKRFELETTVVLGQRKLLQRVVPGAMHAFIFWGFLVLLTTIVEAMGAIVSRSFKLPLIGDTPGLNVGRDTLTCHSDRFALSADRRELGRAGRLDGGDHAERSLEQRPSDRAGRHS